MAQLSLPEAAYLGGDDQPAEKLRVTSDLASSGPMSLGVLRREPGSLMGGGFSRFSTRTAAQSRAPSEAHSSDPPGPTGATRCSPKWDVWMSQSCSWATTTMSSRLHRLCPNREAQVLPCPPPAARAGQIHGTSSSLPYICPLPSSVSCSNPSSSHLVLPASPVTRSLRLREDFCLHSLRINHDHFVSTPPST